jgi:hypothetical protein
MAPTTLDNILIHLPDHDTMMLIDIVNPGWAPVYVSNLTGTSRLRRAPANALAYSWKHFICGYLGNSATATTCSCTSSTGGHQRDSRKAIDTGRMTRYFVKYGENTWAALKGYLDEVTAVAAAPVIEKCTGVLAAADVFTGHVLWVMESIRPDLGYGRASLMAANPTRDSVAVPQADRPT